MHILCMQERKNTPPLLYSIRYLPMCPCMPLLHLFLFEHNTEERKISKRYEPKTPRLSAKVLWCESKRPISFPGRFFPHHLTQTWFPPKVVFMKKRSFLLLTLGSLAVRSRHVNIHVCHFQHIFLFVYVASEPANPSSRMWIKVFCWNVLCWVCNAYTALCK